jgi:dolichol-phosphate mannosyltransferase
MNSTLKTIKSVSVVMPTLNEAGNIADLILTTTHVLHQAGVEQIEIVVADDNSPDGTWEIARRVDSPNAEVQVLRRMKNHGLTPSLTDGIGLATHEVIVWLDCDFSHPPEYIPQMLYMLEQGFDVVVNSRYTIGGGEDRAGKGGTTQLVMSLLLNWGVRFILKPSFSDYTSGFVAVRRPVLKALPLRGDYGEYFVDFIYRALRAPYRVCELPYQAPPRRSGESKTGQTLWQYIWRGRKYLLTVINLRWNALRGKL